MRICGHSHDHLMLQSDQEQNQVPTLGNDLVFQNFQLRLVQALGQLQSQEAVLRCYLLGQVLSSLMNGPPWFVSSGSSKSHYSGPPHLSYSIGLSESHYEGPQWSYSSGSPQYLPCQPYFFQPYQSRTPPIQPFHQPACHCAHMSSPVNYNFQTTIGYKQSTLKFITNRISRCLRCKGSLRMSANCS